MPMLAKTSAFSLESCGPFLHAAPIICMDGDEFDYPGKPVSPFAAIVMALVSRERSIPHPFGEMVRLRGVVNIQHHRKTLFSLLMDLRINELPKWKPQVTISRHVLEEDDG